MDVSENVEIFFHVGIRRPIDWLSNPCPNQTRFDISAPKLRATINNKLTCLTFTAILFLSQRLQTWKLVEALIVYCIDYVHAEPILL
jgi:hypothetical protein